MWIRRRFIDVLKRSAQKSESAPIATTGPGRGYSGTWMKLLFALAGNGVIFGVQLIRAAS
ncbi:hypothetical protein RUM4293_00874 [Ruegeria atlantica]|uniref:Uncharacterized protein n=1 Tax=Ruegeria atlantica TaxID=81569 RepID=A0A0P1E217_9RHOB|nr:hypothetical protein [Ruegeria atlantica]CUH41989.1 hypothetical protein RUM4293_00874 [Ruegeria atlantica]